MASAARHGTARPRAPQVMGGHWTGQPDTDPHPSPGGAFQFIDRQDARCMHQDHEVHRPGRKSQRMS
eukprot:CAMPEP_0195022848 /NCGR_PEP_ID=MMETSP0326_2-20130528/41525_1 /TAXON_ID=2866 ORGANISM="Crypthecodinium cohnii, Strain Seligo" /NCGR_SAMPLE_ID=MMETSP0326_2 /ASSEMBLY_ACC=CAM_ASM_000348 /LENGTH=66 /DNA_ID=CAMNT_0040042845 /DNA_START=207 /DNA_END=403 /DNA_ORIENTATION=-